MAEDLPPGTPEVDDPLLVADLIRLLSIKGSIGRLPLADVVLPVVSLGDVVQPTVETRTPTFRSTDIFSAGILVAPANGSVAADTLALPTGTYDISIEASMSNTGGTAGSFTVEHRDAANAANLAAWSHMTTTGGASVEARIIPRYSFAYEVGQDERIRVLVTGSAGASARSVATIFARLRT